jgi:CHAT domain-containing protein
VDLHLQILAMKGDIEFQYDLAAAERTWTEVASIAKAAGRYAWEGRATGELGCVAFLNGEPKTALKRVVTAYVKAEISNDVAQKIKTLTALGEGLAEFGRPADAIRFFNRALSLASSNPEAYFPFTAYLGKARLLLTSSPAEGRHMLESSLADSRRDRMRVREARLLIVLGDDALRSGDRSSALGRLKAAVTVASQAGLHRLEAEAGSRLASALRDAGDLQGAAEYARSSVAAAKQAGDLYHVPHHLAKLGDIEASLGNLRAAERAYEEAVQQVSEFFSDLPNPRHGNTLVATMGSVFQGYFDLAMTRLRNPDLAFRVLESARARGLVDRIRENRVAAQAGSRRDPAMLQKVVALNRQLAHEENSPVRIRLLDRLWESEVQSLRFDDRHDRANPNFGKEPLRLNAVQKRLEPGEVLVEYWLGAVRSYAFAITRDNAASYLLNGRKEIDATIKHHLGAIRERRDARPEGRELYRLLLEPIREVDQCTRIVIVPDGSIDQAAIGAAVDPMGRYLVETRVISFAPSATAFALLTDEAPGRVEPVRALGVGGARYSSAIPAPHRDATMGAFFGLVAPRFAPLARSGREVADLTSAAGWESRSLTGEDATEVVLKRLDLARFDVLHFALHSAVDREFPDRSGLVLTAHGSDLEDDLLQAREILDLKLNASLVTLSSCDGATGTQDGIAGTNSLVQAFLMAGAGSVVASAWQADDAFTAALMRRFYAELQAGQTKAEALTAAQRDVLKEWGPKAAPVLWAGFRLVGDPHGTLPGGAR